MTNQTVAELYKKLTDLMKAGDETAARAFLKEHLNEFPKEMQEKIVFEFFEEALDKQVETEELMSEVQEKGMETIADIDKARANIEEKQKLNDVRKDLGI